MNKMNFQGKIILFYFELIIILSVTLNNMIIHEYTNFHEDAAKLHFHEIKFELIRVIRIFLKTNVLRIIDTQIKIRNSQSMILPCSIIRILFIENEF